MEKTFPIREAKPKCGGVSGRGSTKGEIRMLSDKEMKKADGEIEQLFEESEIFPAEKSPPDQT